MLGNSVLTLYNNKTYRIDSIDFTLNPKTAKFKNACGFEMTLAEYYKKQYGIDIKDLGQPLLVSKDKRRSASEVTERTLLLVPELCVPCGLTDAMRADFRSVYCFITLKSWLLIYFIILEL